MAAFPLPARTSSLPTLSSSTQAPSRDAGMSLVNLAARQRMLSQRMVLQTVLAARGSDLHLKAARSSLTLFTDSQARLVDTPRHLDATSAEIIRKAYHGPRVGAPPSTRLRSRSAQRWTWPSARARAWKTRWPAWWKPPTVC